ncbi:MAG: hydrolase [Gammaproteobacteria bacterium RIFCSPLOWO2_02_FULL_56_15]|nr:MAG: hydrolase [Gammaproteobacteria bacterium RIFCSPLOWO2_02_FULL_56_15]
MPQKIPLLLLPGLMCDADVWRRQIDSLADIADPIVPDFRGLDSLEAMARKSLAMAPERFAMTGHSMGGRVALEVYRLAPERVLRLALLDTGVHPATAEEPAKRQVYLDLAANQGMEGVAAAWMPPMVHPDRQADRELLEAIRRIITRTSVAEFEGQIRALLQRPDATPILARIQCPTLLLCGRADAWSPPEQHAAIARQISSATLVIIENAGHMITMEQPEAVSLALRAWLE